MSVEALARDILAHELPPEDRPGVGLGDRLAAIWKGANLDGVSFEREGSLHEPLRFE